MGFSTGDLVMDSTAIQGKPVWFREACSSFNFILCIAWVSLTCFFVLGRNIQFLGHTLKLETSTPSCGLDAHGFTSCGKSLVSAFHIQSTTTLLFVNGAAHFKVLATPFILA